MQYKLFTKIKFNLPINQLDKYIEKIPRLFDENKLRSIQLNYQFSNRDLHDSELFCLKMLDYHLSDLCSFSVLKLILQNGIALESDKNAQSDLDSKLEKVYDNILIMNSKFLVDKRFVDFNPLEIAISLITYNCELFGLESWRRKVASVYTRRYKVSICTCTVVIRRYVILVIFILIKIFNFFYNFLFW